MDGRAFEFSIKWFVFYLQCACSIHSKCYKGAIDEILSRFSNICLIRVRVRVSGTPASSG